MYSPSRTLVAHDYTRAMARDAPALGNQGKGSLVDEMEWARHGMTPVFMRKMYEEGLLRLYTLLGMDGKSHLKPTSLVALTGEWGMGDGRWAMGGGGVFG